MIGEIEDRRAALGVARENLCHMAGVTVRTYYHAISGIYAPKPATLKKLNAALHRFGIGFGAEANAMAPAAAYRTSLVLAAFLLPCAARTPAERARLALNSDPGKKATGNADWLDAARTRRLALWIANQMLGFAAADLARAAGMRRQSVSEAVKDLELERERDPGLDRLLATIEGVFS